MNISFTPTPFIGPSSRNVPGLSWMDGKPYPIADSFFAYAATIKLLHQLFVTCRGRTTCRNKAGPCIVGLQRLRTAVTVWAWPRIPEAQWATRRSSRSSGLVVEIKASTRVSSWQHLRLRRRGAWRRYSAGDEQFVVWFMAINRPCSWCNFSCGGVQMSSVTASKASARTSHPGTLINLPVAIAAPNYNRSASSPCRATWRMWEHEK